MTWLLPPADEVYEEPELEIVRLIGEYLYLYPPRGVKGGFEVDSTPELQKLFANTAAMENTKLTHEYCIGALHVYASKSNTDTHIYDVKCRMNSPDPFKVNATTTWTYIIMSVPN